MRVHGRSKPYTVRGLARIPCARYSKCGNMSAHQWQICADKRLFRPLCTKCDVELNEMVMRWVWDDKREADLAAYRESKL